MTLYKFHAFGAVEDATYSTGNDDVAVSDLVWEVNGYMEADDEDQALEILEFDVLKDNIPDGLVDGLDITEIE